MRLENYLNELKSIYGKGLTFIDIDETIYNTFAKIKVMSNGKLIKSLSNQEFNTYELQPDEEFDFSEFRDADLFHDTSIPIEKTVTRIKRMFKNMDYRGSDVILLTARRLFKDMKTFKNRFRKEGIPIDKIYIEFVGDKKTGSISERKKETILSYIEYGIYRRVRLIDDYISNIKSFLSIQHTIPQNILDKVKSNYNISDDDTMPIISFYGLLVKPDGSLKRIK